MGEKKILKGLLDTVGYSIVGAAIGYILVLFLLLLIFGESLASKSLIVGLTTFVGFLYGVFIGILHFTHPKYVGKFVVIGSIVGLILGAISSVILNNYEQVLVIGFPILFGLVGIFFDKSKLHQ